MSYLETVLIILLAGVVAVFVGLYVWWIAPVLFKRKAITGVEALVGKEGIVISDITPEGGEVNVDGIIWKARSVDGTIPVSEKVSVTGVSSLTLIVKRKEQ